MNVEKRALRQLLRERRRRLPATLVEAAGAAVLAQLRTFPVYQSAIAVVGYIAQENEVPTARLLEEVAGSGRQLYLPQAANGEALVHWHPGDSLAVGPGGVLEPTGGGPARPEYPAIALVPVVGWDATGRRLGRGGGFYDRVFAALPREITLVGLAYEFQGVPELPCDPWDVVLHYVITERRIVRCGGAEVVPPVSLQKGRLQL